MQSEHQLVVYANRGQMFGLFVLSLLFVVVGLLFLFTIDDLRVKLLGLVSALFFGAGGAFLAKRAFTQKAQVAFYTYMGQPFIGINVHDANAYTQKTNALTRLTVKANDGLVGYAFNIPLRR